MARVLILSLGGTIAMTGDASTGVRPSLDACALVRAVPAVSERAEVAARPFRRVPGAHLRHDDIVALAAEVRTAVADGFSGVVVTQGTDTIEETAFALDLLLDGDAPVVVTGAMRNASQPGADGPANLLDAVSVAASERARGLGVTVVLGGEIHAARFVRKTHTASPGAFASVSGPLGWVAEGTPLLLTRPATRVHLPDPVDPDSATPPVALLTVALGEDDRLPRTVKDLGYAGLVVEAFGAGHVPDGMVGALAELTALLPVVLCSRTGRGPALRRTYGFPGSEKDLLDRGLISGGHLDGPKARVALALALRAGLDAHQVKDLFHRSFGALP